MQGLIDLNSVPIKNSEALPVDQDNDDSDSEIFRVKRRSSVKIERRTLDNVMNSKSMEQPVSFYWFSIVFILYYPLLLASCLICPI